MPRFGGGVVIGLPSNLLLNGQSRSASFDFPWCRADFARHVMYLVTVESLAGTPTQATIQLGFSLFQPTTGGGGNFEFRNPGGVWQPVTMDDHAGLLPDGDWPAVVADEASTLPLTVGRRIVGATFHKLVATISFVGGASPSFKLSARQVQQP